MLTVDFELDIARHLWMRKTIQMPFAPFKGLMIEWKSPGDTEFHFIEGVAYNLDTGRVRCWSDVPISDDCLDDAHLDSLESFYRDAGFSTLSRRPVRSKQS